MSEEKPDYIGHRERLRQRFLQGGGKTMPDYELLELLLMIAIPRRDVKPLAKVLVKKFGSFAGVINAPMEELVKIDGIKENSVAVLKIIKEGAIRLSWQMLQSKDEVVISGHDQMINHCRMEMGHLEHEEFRVLYLDTKFRLIDQDIQQRGTFDQVYVHPQEIIKSAMKRSIRAIILVHNHPSGDVTPSKADIAVTKKIKELADIAEIELIDHVIISKNDYYSMKTRGLF